MYAIKAGMGTGLVLFLPANRNQTLQSVFFLAFFILLFLLWSLWNIKVTKKLYMFFFHSSLFSLFAKNLETKTSILYKMKQKRKRIGWNTFMLLSYVCVFFLRFIVFAVVCKNCKNYKTWTLLLQFYVCFRYRLVWNFSLY